MAIRFNCECGYSVSLKDVLRGRKIICPQCKRKVRLPKIKEKAKDFKKTDSDILKYADTSKLKEKISQEDLEIETLEDILEKKEEDLIDLSEE